jgi:hypothetical protein
MGNRRMIKREAKKRNTDGEEYTENWRRDAEEKETRDEEKWKKGK